MRTSKLSIALVLLSWTCVAYATDIQLSSLAQAPAQNVSVKQEGFRTHAFTVENGNEKSVDDGKGACEFKPSKPESGGRGRQLIEFCGGLLFPNEMQGLVKDITALPLANGPQSVKVTLLNYNMALGGSLHVPLTIVSGVVANGSNVQSANRLKLLDPDQGKLNLAWTYGGRFRVGRVCDFRSTDKGGCTLAMALGARYLGLENAQDGSSKDVFGGYATAAASFIFPIYDDRDKSTGVGELAIKFGATYYWQNLNGSGDLFPDAVDASGQPIKIKGSYGEYGGKVNLQIVGQLSLQGTFYRAINNGVLGSKGTVAVSYGFQ